MSLRFVLMLLLSPLGMLTGILRPLWGVYWLVFFYHFRPDVWNAPGWFQPVMWISVCSIIGWMLQAKDLRLTAPLILAILLILSMVVSSITARASTEASFSCTVIIIKLVTVMFLLVQLVRTFKDFYQFLWWNVIANLWNTKSVVVLTLVAADVSRVDISTGQGGGANYLAMIFVMGLPLFYFRYLYGTRMEKNAALLITPFYIVAMVGTGSRGGFLTLFVIMLYLIARSKNFLVGVFCMAVVGAVLALVTPKETWDRFMTTFGDSGKERGFAADSRLELWKAAWKMFQESPVTGIGHDNFSKISARYTGFFAGDTPIPYNPGLEQSKGYIGFVTHNTYMQSLAEGGLIGSIPFFAIIIHMFITLRKVRKIKGLDPKLKFEFDIASRTLEGIMLAYFVASTFGSHFKIDFMWWYFGVASALWLMADGEVKRLRRAEHDRRYRESLGAGVANVPVVAARIG